jgi:NADH-quinone oxidoreductase subunit G
MGHKLGVAEPLAARAELEELGHWDGAAPTPPDLPAGPPVSAAPGQAVLATWRLLLDRGRLQDDEPHLAGTAHVAVARVSAATADETGLVDGEPLTVRTDAGAITLPVVVTDMPDRVVWLPTNSAGSQVHVHLGVSGGSLVSIGGGA